MWKRRQRQYKTSKRSLKVTILVSSAQRSNADSATGIKQAFHLLQERMSLTTTNNTKEQPPKPKVGIPKIMHQIWTTDIVPNEFVENVKGLVKLNPPPEWKYYFWPLDVGKKLVEREYPSVLPFYEASGKFVR